MGGHLRSERPVTFNRNQRSNWSGILTAARTVPAATYVSFLVRSHLRGVGPLPERELAALRAAVSELSAFARSLQVMAQLLQRGGLARVPGRVEVDGMERICEALLNHFRALIKANLLSWTTGRAQ